MIVSCSCCSGIVWCHCWPLCARYGWCQCRCCYSYHLQWFTKNPACGLKRHGKSKRVTSFVTTVPRTTTNRTPHEEKSRVSSTMICEEKHLTKASSRSSSMHSYIIAMFFFCKSCVRCHVVMPLLVLMVLLVSGGVPLPVEDHRGSKVRQQGQQGLWPHERSQPQRRAVPDLHQPLKREADRHTGEFFFVPPTVVICPMLVILAY